MINFIEKVLQKTNNRLEILVYISKILFSKNKTLPKVKKSNNEFWEILSNFQVHN